MFASRMAIHAKIESWRFPSSNISALSALSAVHIFMLTIDTIFDQFRTLGERSYGERVTILDHSLQTAHFAQQDEQDEAMIAAALLHDYGHLIHGLDEDIADQGIDGVHEEVGAVALAPYFPPTITEPIRLHVPAKRYLCATDEQYFAELSEASKQSLEIQGGAFSAEQVTEFEQNPHFAAAVQLRRYDDMGKLIGATVPSLESYRGILEKYWLD